MYSMSPAVAMHKTSWYSRDNRRYEVFRLAQDLLPLFGQVWLLTAGPLIRVYPAADQEDLHGSEGGEIYVKICTSQAVFVIDNYVFFVQTELSKFLVVLDHHCYQRVTLNARRVRKSKKATRRLVVNDRMFYLPTS